MSRLVKDNSQAQADTTLAWVARMRAAGAALVRRGVPLGHYFSMLDEGMIATQRDTRDHFPRKLKAAVDAPQVVTVQARGGEKGGAYLIMPLEKAVEALEAQVEEEIFVPITASMREIEPTVDLPVVRPLATGRRMRSVSPAFPTLAAGD